MMNKIQLIVAALIMLVLPSSRMVAGSNDYKIERLLNAEGVTIDGIPANRVKTFSKTSIIVWGSNDAAAMLVKEVATSKLYRLSKRQFDSKGSIKTLEEFFLRTNKTSTRSTGGEAVVTVKRCNDRFSFSERRIALVIGNSAYTYLPSLQNPQSDATAVTDKLLTLGFDVVEGFDCSSTEFRSVLRQFEQIANDYQVVLFYYAGHGIQKNGKNYLVPVTERLQKASDINNCIGCDEVLRSLEGTACNSRIVIFDACRNFSSAVSESNNRGLAQIQQLAPGTMLIYSTGFGQVASDGDGEHSPFAQALLSNIGKSAVSFEMEMKDVARETYRLTSNKQYPAISGTLTENLVLNTKAASSSSGTAKPTVTTYGSSAKAQTLVEQGKKACRTFNYSQAYRSFLEAANMGDKEGCYQLGMLFRNDNFDGANLEQAIVWFERAAEMGHVDAMFQIGEIYLGRDNAKAKVWFKKAAAKGHEKAADRLRRMK